MLGGRIAVMAVGAGGSSASPRRIGGSGRTSRMLASTLSRNAAGGGVATSRASSAVVSSNSATSWRQLSQ